MAEKDEKLKSIATDLKRTQKTPHMLNNGTSRLDHMITLGKIFGNNSVIDFKGESFASKTMFIKSDLLNDSIDPSKGETVIEGKHVEQQFISKIFWLKNKK